jgi:hypothetical protein
VAGRDVDAQGAAGRHEARPRQLGQASAQRREVPRPHLAQPYEHARGDAAFEIRDHAGGERPRELDAPLHRACAGNPGQSPKLGAKGRLQAGRRDGEPAQVGPWRSGLSRRGGSGLPLTWPRQVGRPAGEAQVGQDLDRAAASGDWRVARGQHREAQTGGFGPEGVERTLAQGQGIDLAALDETIRQLELRLDEHHALGTGPQPERQPA